MEDSTKKNWEDLNRLQEKYSSINRKIDEEFEKETYNHSAVSKLIKELTDVVSRSFDVREKLLPISNTEKTKS